MAQPLKVLLVEDDLNDAELIVRELRRAGFEPDWSRVDSEQAFLDSLAKGLDVILSDYEMPRFNGMRALDLLNRAGLEVPFIIVSGTIGEETAVEAMRRGAADYLLKDRLGRLGQSIGRAVEDSRLRRQGQRFAEELKLAEARYRSIFENAVEGIYQCSPGGRVLAANPAMVRILGYGSEGELIGEVSDLRDRLDVEPERRAEFERLLRRDGVALNFEAQARRKDGGVIWISENARVIPGGDQAAHYEGMVEDITERKKAEEALSRVEDQLRQAQKMEAIGRLAGGVAHDFNNLLTVINAYSEFGMDKLGQNHPVFADLREVRKAGERAAGLTRQLLAFSRKQVLRPQVINLNNGMAEAKKMLRRVIGEDVELVAELAPDLRNIKADPGQIEQIVMNLAVNARDAMPFGGKLIIRTENVELDREFADKYPDAKPGSYVKLSITDTGCGMDSATQARIYEPFFTTKEPGKGTGLGLSTVYGIVKQSGAHICVNSELNVGTSFEIYLPIESAADESCREEIRNVGSLSGFETILLVEDEEPVRRLVKRVLSAAGYVVHTASSGSEALLLCERMRDPIHMVLTDVIMPRMSGRELAERLTAIRPDLRVLYSSGYTDDAISRHGVLDPRTHFIAKPFNIVELTRKVREVLDSAPAPLAQTVKAHAETSRA